MTWIPEGISGTTHKVCGIEWKGKFPQACQRKTGKQNGHIEGAGLTGFGVQWRKGNKLNLQGKTL